MIIHMFQFLPVQVPDHVEHVTIVEGNIKKKIIKYLIVLY